MRHDDIDAAQTPPVTRGDCQDGCRPCPWLRCRHHLWSDLQETDSQRTRREPPKIKLHPAAKLLMLDRELTDDEREYIDGLESCALDVADRGGATLREVGDAFDVTRERIRQLEAKALRKLQQRTPPHLRRQLRELVREEPERQMSALRM